MAKAKTDDTDAAPTVGGKMVTYTPLHEGDRPFATWDGIKFVANKPVRVTNADMIASAIGNPWFKVEGHPQAKRVKPTADPVPPPGSGVDVPKVDAETLDKMIEAEE